MTTGSGRDRYGIWDGIGEHAPRRGQTGEVSEPRADGLSSPTSSLRYRVIVTVAVATAAIALYTGIRHTKTEDTAPVTVNGRPDVVEHLIPSEGAQILQQAEIGIDLAPGYEGLLVLDGTTIPRDELRLVPQQNQVFFAPGPGRTFTALPSGPTCAVAIVWESARGRGPEDLTFRWCFAVT